MHFDREKYIRILEAQGLSAALTALHVDTEHWEHESFEGDKGYQPEQVKALEEVRSFSRELWNLAMKQAPSSAIH